jgi:hypothetical protein
MRLLRRRRSSCGTRRTSWANVRLTLLTRATRGKSSSTPKRCRAARATQCGSRAWCASPRKAAALREEHENFRRLLGDVAFSLELHNLREQQVRSSHALEKRMIRHDSVPVTLPLDR